MNRLNKKIRKNKAKIKPKKYKPKILDLSDLFPNENYNKKNIFQNTKLNIDEIKNHIYKKRFSNSVNKIIEKISVLTLSKNIIDSYKIKNIDSFENKDKSYEEENDSLNEDIIYDVDLKKDIYINNEITDKVNIFEDSIKNNTPYKIIYDNYIYNYERKNPKNMKKLTWHCQNYRKIKNFSRNLGKFCYAKIQRIRINLSSKNFKYFIKKNHTDRCIKYVKNLKDKNEKDENNNIKNLDEIEDQNITNKKDFNLNLEEYLKINKENKIDCQSFIKYGLKLYNQNKLNDNFKCDKIYLKNLYYRSIKKYYQLNLENIYEYTEKLPNGEYFCRYISIKQLITKDKKNIFHKAMIFFSDFDIKRLTFSKHLLIDGTFIFPTDFIQTVIIMYYDEIIDKMIPGIFITINNKTEEDYKDVFYTLNII